MAFLIAGFSVVGVTYLSYYNASKLLQEQSLNLLADNLERESILFKTSLKAIKEDSVFLSQTPPVKGVIRSFHNDGFDDLENTTIKIWKRRLSVIFDTFIRQRSSYTQVRFIGVENNGKELVRVNRVRDKFVIVKEENLQEKENSLYFKKIKALKQGDIYISDVNYNRERERIIYPLQPVIRVGVPVFNNEGAIFGMLVINIDLSVFAKSLYTSLAERYYFLTNEQGELLIHPDENKRLAFEFGRKATFQQEFPSVDNYTIFQAEEGKLVSLNLPKQGIGISIEKINFDELNKDRFFIIGLVADHSVIRTASTGLANKLIYSTFGIVLLLSILMAVAVRFLTGRLRTLKSIADRIKSGEEGVTVEVRGRDEIGDLADSFRAMLNRMADSKKELWNLANSLDEKVKVRTEELEDAKKITEMSALELKNTLKVSEELRDEAEKAKSKAEKLAVDAKDSEEKFRSIAETANDAIVSVDSKGNIMGWNKGAMNIFGHKEEDVLGKQSTIIIPEKYRNPHLNGFARYLKTGKPTILGKTLELEGLHKDGRIFPLELSISNWSSEGSTYFTSILRDITGRKRAQEEMSKAKANAEMASKAKSDFLASMSHEIRTPMNAIIGMGELLEETGMTEEQKKYVDTFRYAGENLLNIINDILDLSKIEAGHLELEDESFNLEEVMELTSDIMAFRAHERGLELNVSLAEETPRGLIGDVTRLRQVIINLVGNSVKFTEKGEISISVKSKRVDTNEAELVFSIKDTGIGISPEKQKHIFEDFSQADSSTTRKYGGTGLGLSISKRIVQLMGGSVWVESELGKGSTFHFTAIFKINREFKKRAHRDNVALNGVRILITDDNVTNRMILQKTLSLWGAKTTEVDDGKTCLAELRKANKSGEPYELLLLDFNMPNMDGLEVAKEIKKDTGLNLTVILLTSSASEEKFMTEGAGISRCVSKPVKTSDLRRAINFSFRKMRVEKIKPVQKDELRATDRPLNILLVEDNKDNRNLILLYLKKTSHVVDTAENGQIAVDKFISGKYDLVLMDIEMPVMDGLTATKKIREKEKENGTKQVPIVALTAHALKEHEEKSKEAGCNDHVAKPIKKAKLMETIKKHVDNRKL